MIRQENENKKVFVYSYVTEKTFDAYMYQLVEQKQKFISQIMTRYVNCSKIVVKNGAKIKQGQKKPK